MKKSAETGVKAILKAVMPLEKKLLFGTEVNF